METTSKQQTINNQIVVLKELSDIKESLAVNTNETANIKLSISEIKLDLKDIKSGSVSRIEFIEVSKISGDHENRLRMLEQFKWQLLGALIALQIIGDYVLYIFFKK